MNLQLYVVKIEVSKKKKKKKRNEKEKRTFDFGDTPRFLLYLEAFGITWSSPY